MKLDRPFLAFIIALIIGITFTTFCLFFLANRVNWIVYIALAAILICGTLATVLVVYRNEIIEFLGRKAVFTLEELATPLKEGKNKIIKGDITGGMDSLIDGVVGIGTRIAWMNYRRWMMTVITGLFIGFGALVGSALLYNQNQLIAEQNRNLISQLDLLRRDRYYSEYDRLYNIVMDSLQTDNIRSSNFSKLVTLINRNNIDDNIESMNINFRVNDKEIKDIELSDLHFSNNLTNVNFDSTTIIECKFTNVDSINFWNSSLLENQFINTNSNPTYKISFLNGSKIFKSIFMGYSKLEGTPPSVSIYTDEISITSSSGSRFIDCTFIDCNFENTDSIYFFQCKFISSTFDSSSYYKARFEACFFDESSYNHFDRIAGGNPKNNINSQKVKDKEFYDGKLKYMNWPENLKTFIGGRVIPGLSTDFRIELYGETDIFRGTDTTNFVEWASQYKYDSVYFINTINKSH